MSPEFANAAMIDVDEILQDCWLAAINAAIEAVSAIPLGPPNPYDPAYVRGTRDGRAMALDAALQAIAGLALPKAAPVTAEMAAAAPVVQEVCSFDADAGSRRQERGAGGF